MKASFGAYVSESCESPPITVFLGHGRFASKAREDARPPAQTPIGFGPRKTSTQLKDALDGGFDEKFQ